MTNPFPKLSRSNIQDCSTIPQTCFFSFSVALVPNGKYLVISRWWSYLSNLLLLWPIDFWEHLFNYLTSHQEMQWNDHLRTRQFRGLVAFRQSIVRTLWIAKSYLHRDFNQPSSSRNPYAIHSERYVSYKFHGQGFSLLYHIHHCAHSRKSGNVCTFLFSIPGHHRDILQKIPL